MENKKELHAALILLIGELESIKRSPLKDKNFTASLTTVLKYFRDNGELKAAFALPKEAFEDLKSSTWYAMLQAFMTTPREDGARFPPIDVEKIEAKITSDEYIENKIKEVLED